MAEKNLQSPEPLPEGEMKGDGGSTEGSMECAVCLQTCVFPVQLPCKHIFCFLCVKGVTLQTKRCAMCRRVIPPDFLHHPDLVSGGQDLQIESKAFEDGFQWFYEGRNGWWQYDERTSTEIESHHKNGDSSCELLIAGFLYVIDFQNDLQYRRTDPRRRRKIKRDVATGPKKGVAGIRIESPAADSGSPPPIDDDDDDSSGDPQQAAVGLGPVDHTTTTTTAAGQVGQSSTLQLSRPDQQLSQQQLSQQQLTNNLAPQPQQQQMVQQQQDMTRQQHRLMHHQQHQSAQQQSRQQQQQSVQPRQQQQQQQFFPQQLRPRGVNQQDYDGDGDDDDDDYDGDDDGVDSDGGYGVDGEEEDFAGVVQQISRLDLSDRTSTRTSDRTSDRALDRALDRTSDRALDRTSDRTSARTSTRSPSSSQ